VGNVKKILRKLKARNALGVTFMKILLILLATSSEDMVRAERVEARLNEEEPLLRFEPGESGYAFTLVAFLDFKTAAAMRSAVIVLRIVITPHTSPKEKNKCYIFEVTRYL
jgi:hypothetical protein